MQSTERSNFLVDYLDNSTSNFSFVYVICSSESSIGVASGGAELRQMKCFKQNQPVATKQLGLSGSNPFHPFRLPLKRFKVSKKKRRRSSQLFQHMPGVKASVSATDPGGIVLDNLMEVELQPIQRYQVEKGK